MNRNTILLGRILGIPIGLDYSWFLIFALLTWSLATSYYPAEFRNWPTIQYWIVGAVTVVMLFVSVLLHELGHSAVAMRYKIPVRSITLFVFGGVAQIGAEPPSATAEFRIAIAGPIVSFALAMLFRLLQPFVGAAAPLLALVEYLAYINGTLALFNLIPGFPLDGGRVFRAVVWGITRSFRQATLVAANVGRFVAFLFIFAAVWRISSGDLSGLWIAFIGWFLGNAASDQAHRQEILDQLAGHRVSEVMRRNYTTIPAETTLQQLVDYHLLGSGQRSFVVERGDDVVGLVTLRRIKEVPRDAWAATAMAQVMVPMADLKWVRPDIELWAALDQMDHDGVNQLPVIVDQHMQGMLTRDGIISLLRAMCEPDLQFD